MITIKTLRKNQARRKELVKKLDKLVGDIVKLRDKKCIVCGTTERLTPGHLFSRVAYSTRWELHNLWAQCISCNFRHELDAYPMLQEVSKRIGVKEIDELHRLYSTPVQFKTYQLQILYDEFLVIKKTYD